MFSDVLKSNYANQMPQMAKGKGTQEEALQREQQNYHVFAVVPRTYLE